MFIWVDGALGVVGLGLEAALAELADLFFLDCIAQISNNDVF